MLSASVIKSTITANTAQKTPVTTDMKRMDATDMAAIAQQAGTACRRAP
jgi:hypothetical protein